MLEKQIQFNSQQPDEIQDDIDEDIDLESYDAMPSPLPPSILPLPSLIPPIPHPLPTISPVQSPHVLPSNTQSPNLLSSNTQVHPTIQSPPPFPTLESPHIGMYSNNSFNTYNSLSNWSPMFNSELNSTITSPSPILFRPISSGRAPLPSSEIETEKLIPPADIVHKYIKLKTQSKAPTLAVKLARESVFGVKVLQMCTVAGGRELPALPITEIRKLKDFMFQLFPDFWDNPIHFEPLWVKCIESINQCCKALRSGKK